MKSKYIFLLIALLLIIDQTIKIYVKTHFYLDEDYKVIGNWFRIHFIENEGMVFGWKFGGEVVKILLTLFRLATGIAGIFIIRYFIRNSYSNGLIICAALIYAGAVGNLIDNLFYGVVFGEGRFLEGRVVDMFYFPLIDTTVPSWVPLFGGNSFRFFEYIFNFADACIDIGLITLLLFRKKFIRKNSKF